MNSKPHILLVDDEANFRFSAALALRKAGYAVTEAADGSEALSFVVGARFRKVDSFALILTDMRMPRMSGMELIDGLRGYGIDTPVLVLSGFADRQMIEKLKGMGLSDVLEKPFEPEALVRHVGGILGKSAEAMA